MESKHKIIVDGLSDLIEYEHWVCWQIEERQGKKPAKVPINPRTGARADVTDSGTWASYETARAYHESDSTRSAGIGFVLTEDDPIIGIDLDDCCDESGDLLEWANQIVGQIESYTEYSPSGTGVHILLKGSLPGERTRSENIEVYENNRFLTVTGDHISTSPKEVCSRQAELEAIYYAYIELPGYSKQTQSRSTTVERAEVATTCDRRPVTNQQLLERAISSGDGSFERLWSGNYSGYPSQSEADQALSNHLAFWTQRDPEWMDELFRESGLMRAKWDEQRGNMTYGERTIENSLDKVDNMASYAYSNEESPSNESGAVTEEATHEASEPEIEEVKRVVVEEFDERTWDVTEAVLSAHTTHLLKGAGSGTGLVIVGPSSSGKTTVLEFFDEESDVFYRSDDLTPASFVSHDASKSEDSLQEIDLLPKLSQRTLLSRDLSTWFSGDQEHILKRMALMTYLLDGKGYTRDTGTHGQRGYTGSDYRFNFIGASTPLSARAWWAMGNVGTRLVFHEKKGEQDMDEIVASIIEGRSYEDKVEKVQSVVTSFLNHLWMQTGGPESIERLEVENQTVYAVLGFLARIIQHGRATITEGEAQRENPIRVTSMLFNLAQGHAIINGRRTVTVEDMAVCARVALSTMSSQLRPAVRALLDPANEGRITAATIESAAGVSRPTAIKRMATLVDLGFAEEVEIEDDDRKPKVLEVRAEFEWPEELDFPEF